MKTTNSNDQEHDSHNRKLWISSMNMLLAQQDRLELMLTLLNQWCLVVSTVMLSKHLY